VKINVKEAMSKTLSAENPVFRRFFPVKACLQQTGLIERKLESKRKI
jgi:hypothetical protein